jgi:hypothetical protein
MQFANRSREFELPNRPMSSANALAVMAICTRLQPLLTTQRNRLLLT